MRYRLRTLLILLAIGPPFLAGAWWARQEMIARKKRSDLDNLIRLIQATVAPPSWEEVGGPGSVDQFSSNLTLIIEGGQTIESDGPVENK